MYGVVEWSFMLFFAELFHLMMRISPICSKKLRWDSTYLDFEPCNDYTFCYGDLITQVIWFSGRYLHTPKSFICFGQGFDPTNACCWAYEENHNSGNSGAQVVPDLPSSLLGSAAAGHYTASQNGISSQIIIDYTAIVFKIFSFCPLIRKENYVILFK